MEAIYCPNIAYLSQFVKDAKGLKSLYSLPLEVRFSSP